MSLITRIVGVLKRYAGYDVAGSSGRWPGGYALNAPISQALTARRTASRRIAWLSENSALISSIIGQGVTAVIGDAPTVRPNHPDPAINRDLQNRWNDFAADVDIAGGHALGGYLARVCRGFYIDGESFTQLVADPRTMRLKLRLLAADQIDASVTRPSLGMAGDAPYDVAGIRFDAVGRVTGYHILPRPLDAPWTPVSAPVLVDAADVLHVFEPRTPGIPRGISPLTPIAGLALELDEALDACVVKLKTTALLAMVLKDVADPFVEADQSVDPATLTMEPGQTLRLPSGLEPEFPPVSDMASVGQVLTYISRIACAGASVPHFLATSDFGEINYSAGRLGLLAFQRRVKAIQANHIVAQLLDPVWRRFVLLEVLSGRMRASDYERSPENYGATFLFPGWPPLDELKSAKADTLRLAAKLRSRHEIISEAGRDPTDVDAEIEADDLAPDLAVSASGIVTQTETEQSNA